MELVFADMFVFIETTKTQAIRRRMPQTHCVQLVEVLQISLATYTLYTRFDGFTAANAVIFKSIFNERMLFSLPSVHLLLWSYSTDEKVSSTNVTTFLIDGNKERERC